MPSAALLVNFFEYRRSVWLPKVYIVGLDAAHRPQVVHQTATPAALSGYGIESTPPVAELLTLADSLRDRAVAEHFRSGAKKVPVLAGLLRERDKERETVLRYIHSRVNALLRHCQTQGYPVTFGADIRVAPYPHLLSFAVREWEPLLSFELTERGMIYRLEVNDPDGKPHKIRYLDPKIITNRPTPAWVIIGRELVRLRALRGDALKPFLTRDEVSIPPAEVGRYLREFVSRAAQAHRITVKGFELIALDRPTSLEVTATPHPFSGDYYVYPTLHYGPLSFSLDERQTVKVVLSSKPPYRLMRAERDGEAEAELLAPLFELGLRVAPEPGALSLDARPAPYENLAWLLTHAATLRAAGIEPSLPRDEGRTFTTGPGSLELSASASGDWLDIQGQVIVGDYRLPFLPFVSYLRKGERRFPLPDGSLFLIPEDWFATYTPSLELAKVSKQGVRLTRSQAPLLRQMGITDTVVDNHDALRQADDYRPSSSLRATLRPYQLEGVRWLVRHYHERLGACLADDMGLGKTLQTIAVLLYAKERLGTASDAPGQQIDLFGGGAEDESFLQPLRALIVLPASLLYNWSNELRRFAPSLTVHVNTGTKRIRDARLLRRYDVLLTTYQTALRDKELLGEVALSYIVLDESQQIKNRQSKVFRAINTLAAPHRISLSGTPIENSLSDLWSQMQFINPGLLGSFAFFRKRFIIPIEQHDDERQKEQLRRLVHPHLLRRTKAEVAPELPKLDVQVFYCEMTGAQRKRYDRERAAARNALLGTATPEGPRYKLLVIQTLTRLRQLANHPIIVDADYTKDSGKFREVTGQWDTIRRAGHKVLIFSSMVRHLALFRDHLTALGQPFAWLTGSVPSEQRAVEVRRFQEDPNVQTFFISLKAGGTGLNLTAADYVFILDPWWNPTTEDQAIARAHRIGRTGNVFARKFLTAGTLEEKIYQLQQQKKRLAGEIIDREAIERLLSEG